MFKVLKKKGLGKAGQSPVHVQLLLGKTGQSVLVEYVVTFFLVVGVVTAMSVYVQRLFQGRIHDARNYMMLTVNQARAEAPQLNIQGKILPEYEPYYVGQESQIVSTISEDRRNLPTLANQSGIFRLEKDYKTTTGTASTQAPPRDAN